MSARNSNMKDDVVGENIENDERNKEKTRIKKYKI